MSDEKDQFPRFKKDDFGEGTGWLFAGGLVACAYQLIDCIEAFDEHKEDDPTDQDEINLRNAISKMRNTINATMEAAYAPTEKR